MSLIQ